MADYQEYRRRVLRKRWRRRFMAAALLLLLLLVGAIGMLWKSLHREQRPSGVGQNTILQEVTQDNTWNTASYAVARQLTVQTLADSAATALDFRMAALPKSSTAVGKEWFNDVSFVGDSLTQGMQLYEEGMQNAMFCAYKGVGPNVIVNGTTCKRTDGVAEVPLEALTAQQPRAIYVLLGTNVLGRDTDYSSFLTYYRLMLDMLSQTLPNAKIYVQSITPVRPEVCQKSGHEGLNRDRLCQINNELAAIALEKNCYFLNLWEVLADENGDLIDFRIDFMNRDVPDCLTMTFGVYDNKHLYENQTPPARSNVADYGDELLSDNPKEQREILATFTFELRFDPTYTEQGTVIDVGETFLLDGQSVTLTEAEIYPTHLRLNFDYDPANTAWLTELNFYLENERGERFNGIVNGISATGNPDDPSTDSVWLDSPYFSTGEHLTLHVTGASWIDKGQERVKVDLAKGMIENPPQGVRLEWAEKRDAGWVVSFSAGYRWEKTMHYQIWKNRFYDEDGTAHDINQRGASSSPMILGEISGAELESYEAAEKAAKEEGRYFETFGLKDCAADCVWLEPCWTRITNSTAEIVIK